MKTQIPVAGTWSGAEAIKDRIVSKLDASYDLVYVDYGDKMPEHIVATYLELGREAAMDKFYEDNDVSAWINDSEWDSMDQIVRDLVESDEELDALHEFEYYGILQDEIYGRDTSTPFDDLMRHVDRMWAVYDLDIFIGDGDIDAKKLMKDLGLDAKSNSEKIKELIDNASYGGDVQLLLNADPTEFEGMEMGKEYTFKNVELAIIDYVNGSGHNVTVDAITVKWDRFKLKANDFYAEEVCGFVGNAFQDYTIERKN